MSTCPECKQTYASWVNDSAPRPARGLACCLACRSWHIVPRNHS